MHATELQWIEWVQEFRTPLGDVFFKALRFFDSPEFIFVLLPIIWLNYGVKNGMRLFYILFISGVLNSLLKAIFQLPRPCDLNSQLGLVSIQNYGFPSGAAQTAILLSGLLFYYVKTPWKWTAILPYFLLVSFSRVYLGVHFPTDILGGWFFGFLILLAVLHFIPKIEEKLKELTFPQKVSLHLVFTLTLLHFLPVFFKEGYVACSLGLAVGVILAQKLKVSLAIFRGMGEFLIRTLVGVGGVFTLFYILPFSIFWKIFCMILWVSFVAPSLLVFSFRKSR